MVAALPDWRFRKSIRLAWQRVVTGQNISYKSLQRIEIDAFAWAEDANIQLLADELRDGDYEPSRPSRFYVPKSSGTTRPITLLTILDCIVYQALGNQLASVIADRLQPLYGRVTFSNRLNASSSIYFFKPWKKSYELFENAQIAAYLKGDHWVTEFDFASFYDVVDHRQLSDTLAGLGVHEDVLGELRRYLEAWTDEDPAFTRGHGLPQGPHTSDLLAGITHIKLPGPK